MAKKNELNISFNDCEESNEQWSFVPGATLQFDQKYYQSQSLIISNLQADKDQQSRNWLHSFLPPSFMVNLKKKNLSH